MVLLATLAPEVLDEVFSLISADQQTRKATLAALALTSRSLYPHAFRHIWRMLHSLRPLLNCFPTDLWDWSLPTTEGSQTGNLEQLGSRLKRDKLLRDIRPEDLQHIKKYTDAVRVFYMPGWGPRRGLPIEVYRKLQAALAPTGKCLLPNVTVVHIDRDLDFTPFLSIFISTSLRDLSFEVSSSKPNDVDLSGYPHLEALSIHTRDHPTDGNPATLHMLCSHELSNLRTLWIDTISTTIVTRLASLPNLQILVVGLVPPEYRDAPQSRLCLSGFSNLQELNFRARASSDCATFLRDLPPSLPIKAISIAPYGGFTSADVTSIMSCIATCCSHNSLETILLVDTGGWFEDPEDGPERGLKNSHIEKLLVFKHLRRLKIDIRDIFSLDDSIVRQMSATWPDLTELRLYTGFDQRLHHNLTLTFNGLRDIAQNCPELTCLWISVNTEAISEDLYDLKPTTCKLAELVVVNSPLQLEDTEQVADVLQRIFPSLKQLSCCDDARFGGGGARNWRHVMNLLGLPEEDVEEVDD